MRDEILRDLEKGDFEVSGGGLFLPKQRFWVGGVFHTSVTRNGVVLADEGPDSNVVTDEGVNHILDVVLHGTTPVNPWYVGIFEGNYTPLITDTAATFPAAATESTSYSEATRVEYNEAAAVAKVTSNSANKARFTMTANKTIYGAFLASSSAKQGTTGTLLSAAKFSAPRVLLANDLFDVTYTISGQDV